MCGILFSISKNINQKLFTQSLELLNHRGPDNSGFLNYHFEDYSVFLGHTRLKIIDLNSTANQPFISDCGRYSLVYNGEIYNFKELRKNFIKKGIKFKTNSDTEVLLQCIINYGHNAIENIRGMWAYVLFDLKLGKVFFSVDNVGQKPLFIYEKNNTIIISSEPKSILSILDGKPNIRFDHVKYFLKSSMMLNYRNQTIFEDINTVETASSHEIIIKDTLMIKKNCHSKDIFKEKKDYSLELLKFDLEKAIKYRLQSDVPIGIFISGGIDSSLIAAHAYKHGGNFTYFTGDTKAKINNNDPEYSNKLAEGINVDLHLINCSPEDNDIFEINEEMTKAYDMPAPFIGNAIAMYMMYREVAKTNIKVILDGTGGDEIFGGYYNHFFHEALKEIIENKDEITLKYFMKSSLGSFSKEYIYNYVSNCINKKESSKNSLVERQKNSITKDILPTWILHNDRNAMAFQ